jgi:hypothetical protein
MIAYVAGAAERRSPGRWDRVPRRWATAAAVLTILVMAGPVPTSPGWPPRPPEWWSDAPPPEPLPPVPRNEPEGLGWALVPLLTCGFGTSPAFFYAAVRHGSARLGKTAAGYGLAAGVEILSFAAGWSGIGVALLLIIWLVGSVHAFALRPRLFPGRTPRDELNRRAIQAARYRRELRAQARRLASTDPELARDLRIGRPDLPRTYDDGGLVDINHAPPAALATLPDLTDDEIERIVRLRAEHGGFVSATELGVHAELAPDLVNRIDDYAVFLP